jgi:hypothetical protein
MLCRLSAVAELDDRPEAAVPIRDRAADGDADNAWLLDEWQAGRIILTKVTVTVVAEDAHGGVVSVDRLVDGVWLERDEPPHVEEQVAEVAPGELPGLYRELRERGVTLDDGRLESSYLHVELGERLRGALSGDAGNTALNA